MKTAYFDIFSGISGDMTLGALVDLGVPVEWLKEKLHGLPLEGFDIREGESHLHGIRAVDIHVEQKEDVPARDYHSIRHLLEAADIPGRVKVWSLTAFEKIARAEARIHGSSLDHVHFHEVGGIDALVDIVGSFLCVDYLEISRVFASVIPLGSGSASCSHGIIPVPAPATLAILKGVPVKDAGREMEMVTPTGAAIITTLAAGFGAMPGMVVGDVGYGSGKRRPKEGLPNLLRVVTGEVDAARSTDSVYVVETSIDDMTPEISGFLMERLFEAGALDVCHIPIQMKKNRPGTRLEVLAEEGALGKVVDMIFRESTTTGVRYHRADRVKLGRRPVRVETRFGTIGAKEITDSGGEVRIVPEYEVCRRVALEQNLPLREVYIQVELDMSQARL